MAITVTVTCDHKGTEDCHKSMELQTDTMEDAAEELEFSSWYKGDDGITDICPECFGVVLDGCNLSGEEHE